MLTLYPSRCSQQPRGETLAAFAPMQGHCTTWLGYRIAVFTAGKEPAQQARMFIKDQLARLEPADATMISYTLLRHLGFMLDELSAQG